MIDIIKEYLASVGFAVDKKSFDEVNKSFSTLEQTVNKFLKALSGNKAFTAFSQKFDGAMAAVTARIGAVRLLAIGAVAGIVAAVGVLVVAITAATATFMSKIAQAELSVQKLAISLFTSVENARSLQNVMKAMDIKSIEDLKYVNLMPEQREQFMSLRKLSMELAPSAEVKQGLGIIRSVGYALQRLQMTFGYLFQSIAGTLGQIMKGPLKDLKNGINSVTKFLANHMPEISETIAMVLGIFMKTFAVFMRVVGAIFQIIDIIIPLRKIGQFFKMIGALVLYLLNVADRISGSVNGFLKTYKERGAKEAGEYAKQEIQHYSQAAKRHGKAIKDTVIESAPKANPTTQAGQKLLDTVKGGSEAVAYNFLRARGYSHEGAAAIIANLKHESGLRPNAVGDGGTSFGIAQWHKERATAGSKFLGKSLKTASLTEQLDYLVHELKGYPSLNSALKTRKSPSELAAQFTRDFERPADIPGQSRIRGRTAEELSKKLAPQQVSVNINVYGVKDPELAAEMVSRKLQTALNSRNLQGAYA